MSKWRKTFCKKRGFRSGFRLVPGPLLESKNACGCSAVAFFTRVPPRVPAGSAGLRPCKCANGLRLPAKNGGFLGQLLEGPARVLQDPGVGPCWIQMGSGQAPGSAADSVGFCRGFRGCPLGSGHAGMSAGFWPRSCENGPRLLVKNDGPHGQLLEGRQSFAGTRGEPLLDVLKSFVAQ